jgi:hypothetical protein
MDAYTSVGFGRVWLLSALLLGLVACGAGGGAEPSADLAPSSQPTAIGEMSGQVIGQAQQSSTGWSGVQSPPLSSVATVEAPSQAAISSAAPAPTEPNIATVPEVAWQFYQQRLQAATENLCEPCHQSGAIAGATGLQFKPTDPALGAKTLAALIETAGADYLLQKMAGFANHGGGAQVGQGSRLHADFGQFARLILPAQPELPTSRPLLEPPERSLRRALLIVAGRLPTQAEQEQARLSEWHFARVLREAMTGDGFKRFLLRAANDQLLTDAFLNGRFFELSNGFSPFYPVAANRRFQAYDSADALAIKPFEAWNQQVYQGMVRAPLELIARVIMADEDYRQILLADYTLGNSAMAELFRDDQGMSMAFAPSMSSTVTSSTVPSSIVPPSSLLSLRNRGQVLQQAGQQHYLDPRIGLRIDAHGDWVDYPHAGLLNEPAFLARYPSTETNRHRLRAKQVYRLFLGVDIDASAARAPSSSELTSAQSPGQSPACTACHDRLDSVAAAFQNYGPEGWFRSSFGGLDALPDSYKRDPHSGYQSGDLWYRDQIAAGFEGQPFAEEAEPLQELARQLVADPRFAQAVVQFWWPAVIDQPQDNPLQAELATQFREGFQGEPFSGMPFNLKDLLLALLLSDAFRGVPATLDAAQSHLDLAALQVPAAPLSRLSPAGEAGANSAQALQWLTPEELDLKVKQLVSFAWGEREDPDNPWGYGSLLLESYRLEYGGIDGVGVTERSREPNSLMVQVAEAQAIQIACGALGASAALQPAAWPLLPDAMRYITPFSVQWQRVDLPKPQALTVNLTLPPGASHLRLSHLNPETVGALVMTALSVTDQDGQLIVAGEALTQQLRFSEETSRAKPAQPEPTGFIQGPSFALRRGYVELPLHNVTDQPRHVTLALEVFHPVGWSRPAAFVVDLQRVVEPGPVVGLEGLHSQGGEMLAGEVLIREQLVEWFWRLHGLRYEPSDLEVSEAYDLFLSLWQTVEMQGESTRYGDYAGRDCPKPPKWRQSPAWVTSDPNRLVVAWSHLLTAFMSDFYFLHE